MLSSIFQRFQKQSALRSQLAVFGVVGCVGLASDMAAFTLLHNSLSFSVFIARLVSLAYATWVTWTLNRSLTFAAPVERSAKEASRYLAVTCVAQGISYVTFAVLVTAFNTAIPQMAVVAGAVAGAGFSFVGHKMFSFRALRQRF